MCNSCFSHKTEDHLPIEVLSILGWFYLIEPLYLKDLCFFFFYKYLAELSLLEADPFLKYLPSQTAAAAYCLANYTVNRSFWVRITAC